MFQYSSTTLTAGHRSTSALDLPLDRFRVQVANPGRRPEVHRDGRKRPRHEQADDAQDDQYLGHSPIWWILALGTILDRLSTFEFGHLQHGGDRERLAAGAMDGLARLPRLDDDLGPARTRQ